MTLQSALKDGYGWAIAHATLLLAVSLAWPIAGIVAARIGKAGKTDADGRFIASVVVGVAVVAALVALGGLFATASIMNLGLTQVDLRLLLAPPACALGSLLGIRLVFPLSELGSVRSLGDIAAFFAVCAAIGWLFSKFRGWGLYFVGSLGELLVFGGLGLLLLRRLYRRAFR